VDPAPATVFRITGLTGPGTAPVTFVTVEPTLCPTLEIVVPEVLEIVCTVWPALPVTRPSTDPPPQHRPPGTPTPGTPTPGTPTPGAPTPGAPTPGTPTRGLPVGGPPAPCVVLPGAATTFTGVRPGPDARFPPAPRADAPARTPPGVATAALLKAASRVAAGVLGALGAALAVAMAGDNDEPSPGRPSKATIALDATNSRAAQATSAAPDPKPAPYARAFAIAPLNRPRGDDPLAVFAFLVMTPVRPRRMLAGPADPRASSALIPVCED
jgi:hypothetical protein